MENLTPYEFDQTAKGWRRLDAEGKSIEAAEEILHFISNNQYEIDSQDRVSIQIMFFHVGQLYATSGEQYYNKAIQYFQKSFHGTEGWDLYVGGTIAFLNTDKEGLLRCADRLSLLAESDEWLTVNAEILAGYVASLADGITYAQAYGR